MTYGIMQPPPFEPLPESILVPDAIVGIGLMFAHIIILLVLMVLLIHCYRKFMVFPLEIVIYLFSLIIGFMSFDNAHTPFSPWFEVFFLVFQTIIFLLIALETFNPRKEG